MLFFTAAILLCAVRDGQCKTSESLKNVLAKIDHQVPAPNLVSQGLLILPSLFLSIFYTICVIFGNSWQLQKSFKIG